MRRMRARRAALAGAAALALLVTTVLNDSDGTRAMVDRASQLLERQLLATWSAQLIQLIDPVTSPSPVATTAVTVGTDGHA